MAIKRWAIGIFFDEEDGIDPEELFEALEELVVEKYPSFTGSLGMTSDLDAENAVLPGGIM